MCGILAAFGIEGMTPDEVRRLALKQTKILRHRGPDSSMLYQTPDGRSFMAHERLNIVDASDRGRFGSEAFKLRRPRVGPLLARIRLYVQATFLYQE
jgi:asparagine synthetase B (glutamine-hydrolysing)